MLLPSPGKQRILQVNDGIGDIGTPDGRRRAALTI
jgi:hypothetical protein